MHLGELSGWASVALGQIVSWPQVLKLRRERGDGVSLASYAIVLVSMSLFWVHALAIGDMISALSLPISLIPNVVGPSPSCAAAERRTITTSSRAAIQTRSAPASPSIPTSTARTYLSSSASIRRWAKLREYGG